MSDIKDGTRLSGYVTVKENQPPRQCNNCRWYSKDACHNDVVMIDPEVDGEKSQPKPVGEMDCCDNFQNTKSLILLVLRHGETGLNKEKKFRSLRNVPLNEDGIDQAQKAAEFLKDFPIKKIVCSPLDRAYHTALFVEELCGAPIIKDAMLLPWNLGDLSGKSRAENKAVLQHHIDNPEDPVPGGESLKQFQTKMFSAFDKYIGEASADNLILIVGHTSTLSCLNRYIDDEYKGAPETDDEATEPGGVSAVYSDDDKDEMELQVVFGKGKKADYGS